MEYKHYFPVSHLFNRDPEVRELREKYGDWMALVWLEMLSWGDRSEGKLKGELAEISRTLAGVRSRNYPRKNEELVRNSLGWMEERGWIEIRSDHIQIVNYLKYHRVKVSNSDPIAQKLAASVRPSVRTSELKEKEEEKESVSLNGNARAWVARATPRVSNAAPPAYPSASPTLIPKRTKIPEMRCPDCGIQLEGYAAYEIHFDQKHLTPQNG